MNDELEGVALSDAVSYALGLMRSPINGEWFRDGTREERRVAPHIETDFHTPEGEHRLRAEIERLGEDHSYYFDKKRGHRWKVWHKHNLGIGDDKKSAATALARAFLAAMAATKSLTDKDIETKPVQPNYPGFRDIVLDGPKRLR